ncbi:MAG: hypothetical protein VKJ64_21240 [Leptolyngbyaceae bacterium]|nr:hypothetical protein [Leptolyngbyaceae bacterium]
MLPSVLSESCIQPFKFYDGHRVREAIFVQKTFYRYVALYLNTHRQRAYDTSISLANQGYHTVITASEKGLKVWVDVRCQERGCEKSPTDCQLCH